MDSYIKKSKDMKKIVIIDGGPRRSMNTAQLLQKFAEGAESVGKDIEVKTVRLYSLDYKGCMSCMACKQAAMSWIFNGAVFWGNYLCWWKCSLYLIEKTTPFHKTLQVSNIIIHTEIASGDPSLRIGITGSRFL